jgi:hypothetical protein
VGTVPLPAWLRRWQQSFTYQVVLVPFIVGFGGFLLADGCLKDGIFAISKTCVESAFSGYVVSMITVFVSGKSVGSAEFKPDGTTNATVANVVAIQAKATAEPTNDRAAAAVQRVATLAATEAPPK